MKVSIIIPVYNEEKLIKEIVALVQKVDFGDWESEIVVVNDASTDRTGDAIATIDGIHALNHERNRGKGGAIKTGIAASTGDVIVIQDADLEYDPNDLPAVLRPVVAGKCSLTLGVRIQPDEDHRRRKSLYWLSWLGNKVITWSTNLLYWNDAGEYEGCYKAFSRELINSMTINTERFAFDNELVCKALKRGYKTMDVPIRYAPRSYDDGKKIGWRDGLAILWTIAKYRFSE